MRLAKLLWPRRSFFFLRRWIIFRSMTLLDLLMTLRIGLEVYVRTRIVAFLEPMRLFFCGRSSRHSQSNFRKSNSIEFNRTQSVDWVRLIPAIERNRTPNFVWVRFTNQSNLIVQIEPKRTQCIGLCSIEFSYRTQSNTVQWIAFDCVRWINWLGQRSCYVVWLPAWLL